MDLPTYVENQGRGAVSELVRESGLSRPTVQKALRGEPITAPAAKALSKATGGEVDAAALAGLGDGA